MAPPTPSKSPPSASYAAQLLRRAHSPTTASSIHAEKLKHKPLVLHATATKPSISAPSSTFKSKDARTIRRDRRNAKLQAQGRRRRKKPQPLSAKEKRRLCLFEIPKEERKYSIYAELHRMWCAYMREILGIATPDARTVEEAEQGSKTAAKQSKRRAYVTPQVSGPLLVSADFHGAEIEVVRSRCVSRVGVKGIVVRDTRYIFEVITVRDELKTLPKEHSVFRFEVPLRDSNQDGTVYQGNDTVMSEDEEKPFVFELHGENFQYRASDRASKKFKVHIPPDL